MVLFPLLSLSPLSVFAIELSWIDARPQQSFPRHGRMVKCVEFDVDYEL
jgi:hypothetical protein